MGGGPTDSHPHLHCSRWRRQRDTHSRHQRRLVGRSRRRTDQPHPHRRGSVAGDPWRPGAGPGRSRDPAPAGRALRPRPGRGHSAGLRAAFLAAAPSAAGVSLATDAHTAALGAHGGAPGAVIAVGTGSVGYRLHADGSAKLVGGWGFPGRRRGQRRVARPACHRRRAQGPRRRRPAAGGAPPRPPRPLRARSGRPARLAPRRALHQIRRAGTHGARARRPGQSGGNGAGA